MKKTTIIIIYVLSISILNCAFPSAHHVFLREVLLENVSYKEQSINSMCFVGIQLYNEYYVRSGLRGLDKLRLNDSNGIEKIAKSFVLIFDQGDLLKIKDGVVDNNKVNNLLNIDFAFRLISTQYLYLNNHCPLFDMDNNHYNTDFLRHSDLHPLLVDFINKNCKSENYLVVAIRFDDPIFYSEENGVSFSLSIVISVYNNYGVKIFSKIYRKSFSNVKVNPLDAESYYTVIRDFVQENKEIMNNDLSFIKRINDHPVPNLQSFLSK
jgi:hypothetical protein